MLHKYLVLVCYTNMFRLLERNVQENQLYRCVTQDAPLPRTSWHTSVPGDCITCREKCPRRNRIGPNISKNYSPPATRKSNFHIIQLISELQGFASDGSAPYRSVYNVWTRTHCACAIRNEFYDCG